MSSADLTVLRYVAESTFGTTPATPALKQLRYTGESLNYEIENTKSSEITPTRVDVDLVQTAASASGDINFEFSYGTFDDFLEAAFCGAWTTDVLKNGTSRKSFTIQKSFPDLVTPLFHNFRGCCIEGFNFKLETGKITEGSFSVMGLGNTQATAQIAGATFPAVSTTTPMNGVANVANITLDGVAYTGCISTLSFDLKNNIRAIQCLGSLAARDMKLGTLEITGDMEIYFSEGSNYDNFTAGASFDISFDMIDDAGNKYSFSLPKCKFESAEVVAGSKNSDVMFSGKYRALYDATSTSVASITRDPA